MKKVAMTARFPNPRSAFRRGGAMHLLLGETVPARSAGMRAALNPAFRHPQWKFLAISILEPVWKPRGALRRGILAVAKAALAARSAPQRAVRNEPTPATDKRPAARRGFGEKAGPHQAPGFLPRLHRMERRGVSIGFPSSVLPPRSSRGEDGELDAALGKRPSGFALLANAFGVALWWPRAAPPSSCHPAFSPKTAPLVVSKQALTTKISIQKGSFL